MGTVNLTQFERTRMLRAGTGGDSGAPPPPPPPIADTIMALTPIGYWKLDETSGTNANDSTANNRDGTYTSTYTLAGVNGPDGIGYVSLGGGYITIADVAPWSVNDSGNGLTIFCVARPTAGTLGMFVSKGNTGQYEWQLALGTPSTSDLSGSVFNLAASNSVQRVVTGPVTNNAWQALAFAIAHNPVSSTLDLNRNNSYLTGTASGSATTVNGTAALVIGHRADLAAGHDFTGAIGHVAVFARRLSSGDMGTLMTAAGVAGWS